MSGNYDGINRSRAPSSENSPIGTATGNNHESVDIMGSSQNPEDVMM